MKYPFINSLVPAGEHFDETAVGEGIWFSAAHVLAIEQAGTSIQEKTQDLATASEEVSNLTTEVATQQTTILERDAKIVELENEVARLGALPSGNGSSVTKAKDETVDQQPVPAYLSDDSPENVWLDKQMKKKK